MRQFDAQTGGAARPKSAYTRRTVAAVPARAMQPQPRPTQPKKTRLSEKEDDLLKTIRRFEVCCEESSREQLCAQLQEQLAAFAQENAATFHRSASYWLCQANLAWRRIEMDAMQSDVSPGSAEEAWQHIQRGVKNLCEPIAVLADGARDLVLTMAAHAQRQKEREEKQKQREANEREELGQTGELKDVCNVVKKLNLDDVEDEEDNDHFVIVEDVAREEVIEAEEEEDGVEEKEPELHDVEEETNNTFTKDNEDESTNQAGHEEPTSEEAPLEQPAEDALVPSPPAEEATSEASPTNDVAFEQVLATLPEDLTGKEFHNSVHAASDPSFAILLPSFGQPQLQPFFYSPQDVPSEETIEGSPVSTALVSDPLFHPLPDHLHGTVIDGFPTHMIESPHEFITQSHNVTESSSGEMLHPLVPPYPAEFPATFVSPPVPTHDQLSEATPIHLQSDAPSCAVAMGYQLEDISDDDEGEVPALEGPEAEADHPTPVHDSVIEGGDKNDVEKNNNQDSEEMKLDGEVDDVSGAEMKLDPKTTNTKAQKPNSHLSQPYASSAVRLLVQQQSQPPSLPPGWSPWSNGEKGGANAAAVAAATAAAAAAATPPRCVVGKNSVVTPVRRSTRLTPRVPALEEKRRVVEDWASLSPESKCASVLKPNRALLEVSFAQAQEEEEEGATGEGIPDNWEELL